MATTVGGQRASGWRTVGVRRRIGRFESAAKRARRRLPSWRLPSCLLGVCLVSVLASARASAGEVRWRASSELGCSSAAELDAWVAQRRERPDTSPASATVIFSRAAARWTARIILTQGAAGAEGERVLEVESPDCFAIQQYATLALALLLDGASEQIGRASCRERV